MHAHAHTHTHACTRMHTHACTHARTHVRTHTHTHTPTSVTLVHVLRVNNTLCILFTYHTYLILKNSLFSQNFMQAGLRNFFFLGLILFFSLCGEVRCSSCLPQLSTQTRVWMWDWLARLSNCLCHVLDTTHFVWQIIQQLHSVQSWYQVQSLTGMNACTM